MKFLVRKNPIDLENSNTETIKRLIYNVKKNMKKVENLLRNGMQRHVEC